MADNITCEKCGFLALRNRLTGLLDEAPQEYRWRAEIPTISRQNLPQVRSLGAPDREYPYTGVPLCLVRAYPLHNEFTDQNHASGGEIFGTLTTDRNCADRKLFTPWQQGFTPKEHREMLDRKQLLELQTKREDDWQRFQEQMAADDKKWREQQEKDAEARHKEQLQEMRGIHNQEMKIMGGIVTAVIFIITIIGSSIQAGWFPRWFGLFGN